MGALGIMAVCCVCSACFRMMDIANDDTKQLQDSKQMHVCFSPELFS